MFSWLQRSVLTLTSINIQFNVVNINIVMLMSHTVCIKCTSFLLFTGRNTYQDGVNFIRQKFVNLNRNPSRKTVYTHVTCATDTHNIQYVFQSCTEIIIQEHLREAGLIWKTELFKSYLYVLFSPNFINTPYVWNIFSP